MVTSEKVQFLSQCTLGHTLYSWLPGYPLLQITINNDGRHIRYTKKENQYTAAGLCASW